MDLNIKRKSIQEDSSVMSIKEKCEIMSLNRSSLYYVAKELEENDIQILYKTASIFAENPFMGYRKVHEELKDEGLQVGREKTRKNMKLLGLKTMYPQKTTTIVNKEHKKYPYLLRDLEIIEPNQVWATDITYIWNGTGFYYLVAIIDWYSRRILSWKLSNTMDKEFCIDALEEALAKHPKPQIFNTDQGSQFTSTAFTGILIENNIKISMDGKGRALDNIIIERFWRSIKYENIFLNEYLSGIELKAGIEKYMVFYNTRRKHATLKYKTPLEVHCPIEAKEVKKLKSNNRESLIDYKQFRSLILKKAA